MSAGNRKHPQIPPVHHEYNRSSIVVGFLVIVAMVGLLLGAGITKATAAQPKHWKECKNSYSINCVYDGGAKNSSYIRWVRNERHPEKVTLKFISSDRAKRLLR